ncbi:Type IV pilus biogenesis and competence protein PilQ [BD1-7 clade bacterium]|uniref:Type IV pilus biogenesis and competence protein PilQ n=1 Tax=BD1-7 clade bacterium TaxID=2029982 RepID=A0A5S9Q918_9GAMM|nr:Type IV pilus biogenesis and competence protein PilQ [BD1-7 clade bacterium]
MIIATISRFPVMKRIFSTVALSLFSVVQAFAVNMVDADFSALPDDRVEMRFTFDGDAPDPKVFAIETPARLAIDLEGVQSLLGKKKFALGLGDVDSTVVLTSGNRTRVIVNMVELGPYDTRVEGNELVVSLGGDNKTMAKQAASVAESQRGVAEKPRPQKAKAPAIESVDFRRGDDGEGRLIVDLSSPYIDVNSEQKGEAIELTFKNTQLPEELQLRYDVADFATPIKSLDAKSLGNDTVIKVMPTGEYEYLAYQSGETYVLTVKALTEEEIEARKKEFTFVGDKLSLNFQDIEIRSVLQLIADFTDLNLVASDTVNGKITLRLQNVPWDQALDLILKTKGLDKRQEGNVLLVAPAAEIAQREQQEIQTNKQLEELAPLQTEFIRIRYADANNISEMLDGENNSSGRDNRILTDRAMVVVDERTNSLLITETASKLAAIRRLINLIDVPVRQVMIEARIVIATDTATESLGIKWGGFLGNRNDDRVILASGSDQSIIDVANGDDVEFGNVVDLGVADVGATQFNLGLITDSGILNLELSAIETAGDGEVLSQPKIITGDKQKAIIKSGTEIPYETTAPNGGTTIAFRDAALILDVTPSITPDNRVIMKLDISQDSPGEETGNGIPTIDTNQLETEVLVNNGETIVLGGVFSSQELEQITKTPFLGDIPYLGRLFKRTIKTSQKTELLIFVTPKIMADQLVQ